MVEMRFRTKLAAAAVVVLSMAPEDPGLRYEEIDAVEFFEDVAEAVMGRDRVLLMVLFVPKIQLLAVIPCVSTLLTNLGLSPIMVCQKSHILMPILANLL